MDNVRKNSHRLEGNTLAILDSSGIREACDIHEDRLSFLDAVRGASLASITPSPPTWKMYDAILRILREGKSLELAVASFKLLTDLDKRYPRVYLRESDNLGTDSSGARVLVVDKEAWSPFILETGNTYCEASQLCRESKSLLDPAEKKCFDEEQLENLFIMLIWDRRC